ncbi:reverse transcriptase domain-containing protein [Tanacetum coccineum]
MPKHAKFLKGLLTNKARLKEACKIIMNERCSAILLNKLPSKEKDLVSFTIPCDIGQLHIDNALTDLGASISLMPYTMYKKLSLGEPKAIRMSLELADRSFLATARAMIDMFNKKITLRVGDDEVIFDIDQSIKRPTTEDDECYRIDDLDEMINEEAHELLTNEEPDSFDSENSIRRINSVNTPYPITQGITNGDNVKSEHLYSASANEIDEKKPELKNLPQHLEYAYLNGDKSFPIIISSELSEKEKTSLLQVQDVMKNEIMKLLDSGLIYPISDSSWVSPIHVVPKKGGMTVVLNDNNQLIPSRTVTGWRVCIDYRKLNDATRKDHFPLPFIDQMLERLCGNEYYCFLDGFSGFFQIPIALEDQEKTTFTCPYGTFAYRRMPFGLCNAPATFQRCMTAIFHDMVEDFMEVFMDDFSVFEGIVLGHKISGAGIEVDRAKIDVIAKLPYPTNVKGVRSFLGHAGFYRRFIKDFSMISKLMTQLLMKDAKFDFSDDCKKAFNILKENLTTAPIIISLDWNAPFELMCNASDFVVGAVLGQRIDGKFKPLLQKTVSEILAHCHSGTTGGHHSALITGRKVYESGFYWPSIFKDAKDYVMKCDACQRSGNISSRSEMPQNNIQIEHKAYWALKQCNMDLTAAAKNRFMELNELIELRDEAYENTRIYKERTNKWHDSRLEGDKNFKEGDKDLVKEISTNIGEEFTNMEILKCWSLETSRRLFNTQSCS